MKTREVIEKMAKIVRNILPWILLAVFVLSVIPMVLAEETEGETDVVEGSDDEIAEPLREGLRGLKEDIRSVRQGAREEVKELRQEARQEVGEQIREVTEEASAETQELRQEMKERAKKKGKKFLEEGKEKLRNQAKGKINELKGKFRERYHELKVRHKEARTSYHEHRVELRQLKKDAKGCKEDSEDCPNKRLALKKGVKQHLLKTEALIDRSLEKLTNRVEASKALSEEDKEEALAKIAGLEERLTTAREKVEALKDEATNEDLKAAIKELKQTWQDIRKEQRRIVASLVRAKLESVVEKHVEFENGMQMRIDQLQEQGVDTSELEKMKEEFASELEDVKEKQQEADEAWQQAGEGSINEFREAQRIFREEMEGTKEVLRKFMREYRQLKKTTSE